MSIAAKEHAKLAAAERSLSAGDLVQAETLCREVIALNSADAEAHDCLGAVLYAQGRTREALSAFETALHNDPELTAAYDHLAATCLELGRPEEAARFAMKSREISPHSPHALVHLGEAMNVMGQFDEAFSVFAAALELAPHDDGAVQGTLKLLSEHGLPATVHTPEPVLKRLETAILEAYHAGRSETNDLARAAAALVRRRYGLEANQVQADPEIFPRLSADELFLRLLQETINIDPFVECFCETVRRALLLEHEASNELPQDVARVAAALALQAFHNEHIWWATDEEETHVAALEQQIEAALAKGKAHANPLRGRLLLYAMYRPLAHLEHVDALLELPLGGETQRLVALTVREEREIYGSAARIATIAAPEDQMSLAVEAQYEAFPYPRWFHLVPPPAMSLSTFLRRRFPNLSPPAFSEGPIDILVAGCGTGKHPIRTALRFRNARVLAIDLSRASLAYAARMARKYGVDNIEFAQADIVGLKEFERRFHMIECFRVLHHLQDPAAGWRILSDLLIPDGLFHVGLYVERGRQDVVAARKEIAGLDPDAGVGALQVVRRHILGSGEPALAGLLKRADFYATSGCRELFYPACEHPLPLPEIKGFMEQSGMNLLGVFVQPGLRSACSPPTPLNASMADLNGLDGSNHAYVRGVGGMYQMLCQKPASSETAQSDCACSV